MTPTKLADGQSFITPTAEEWEVLVGGGNLLGRQLGLLDFPEHTAWRLRMAAMFPELRVGVEPFPNSVWLPIVAVCLADGSLRKVHLEVVICGHCNHRVLSCNHLLWDLFITTPDSQRASRNARELPRVACPVCGGVLPRPSIWAVEYTEKEEEPKAGSGGSVKE